MKYLYPKLALAGLAAVALTPLAMASLESSYQFNGRGNWSLDAVGSNNSPVGTVQAYVPVGSIVEKAFLYSSLSSGSLSSVNFDGTVLDSSDFTSLGFNSYLHAYRADVTSLVSAKVGSGSATRFDFSVLSENPNTGTDGELLAVVYRNAGEAERTIAFLDGFSTSASDSFSVNLGSPLIDPTTPGFEALLSLGIGFGYQPSGQYSRVDIDGRRLTTSAGGQDDGISADGGLITVGGLDDTSTNPNDPFATDGAGPRSDDELYNLAQGNGASSLPFLSTGSTHFTVNTQNPSGDDNIFFAALNITARAGVDQPPPPPVDGSAVPEPSTYGIIGGIALLGLALRRRFKK
ncbi:MAG TPA: PEP-CTERM sorting domain-containing protein [Opitutaceae bacterium]|nr:PEP-CTERM sorting domain-containing protein [Opitutaceae bacterium]